jgi:hypothetical protein
VPHSRAGALGVIRYFSTGNGMAFTLTEVVPWGRSFDEYRQMFRLSDSDLRLAIVGCADGPASFNAELTQHGGRVVSCDPIYKFDAGHIKSCIDATYDDVLDQTRIHPSNFVWSSIQSIEELGRIRMAAMLAFLKDYEKGGQEGRYIAAQLATLPFKDASFDLALCSHFLFLYTKHFSLSFHRETVAEMCRVAKEVRIFPLIDLDLRPSPYVDQLITELRETCFTVSIETVPYEFQRGGNKMMRIVSSKNDKKDTARNMNPPEKPYEAPKEHRRAPRPRRTGAPARRGPAMRDAGGVSYKRQPRA